MRAWAGLFGLSMILVTAGKAAAADACSDLVERPAAQRIENPCVVWVEHAMADLDARITPRCRDAARAGTATETLARLVAIAQERVRVEPCALQERQWAKYALCRLRPAGHRDWLRWGVTDGVGKYDVPDRLLTTCLSALQQDGDAGALLDAVDFYAAQAQQGVMHIQVLRTLMQLDREVVMLRLLPRFEEAISRGLSLRSWLHSLLCDPKEEHRPPGVAAACDASTARAAEQRQREEAEQERQAAARRRDRQDELRTARPILRGLQVFLTVASVGVTSVKLGYTFGSDDLPTRQALTTLSGIHSGVFTVLDAFVLRRRTDLPTVVLMSLLLPVGALAGGGIAYGASQHPASLAVLASTQQAFTLASALAFIWSVPIE
ncbi:MAG: hypothetical protein JNJ46_20250 [Myxococcales bacterium]|nr:hypothetical protein [Myxococcales bacterium]